MINYPLDKEDRFYEIKLQTIKNERFQQIEAAEKFEERNKKNKQKIKKLVEFADRRDKSLTNQKVKSLIDLMKKILVVLDQSLLKKNKKVSLTTRFLNGKMLMFDKVSIKSFVYDLIDVFMFPTQEIQDIYQKYQVAKCYLYQNLTDTDSTSIFLILFAN